MTDDEIKALALAHGFKVFGDGTICAADRGVSGDCTASLPALCRAIERATLERAAGVCDEEAKRADGWQKIYDVRFSSQWVAAKASANLCASRIRALAPNQPSRPVAGNTQE